MIKGLQARNTSVAADEMREQFPEIDYADSAANALEGASAALLVTEWNEFVALDGRRIDLPLEERDLEYEGLCW